MTIKEQVWDILESGGKEKRKDESTGEKVKRAELIDWIKAKQASRNKTNA